MNEKFDHKKPFSEKNQGIFEKYPPKGFEIWKNVFFLLSQKIEEYDSDTVKK